HSILLRVAIEIHDLVDRLLVAQESEWRDQGTGAHSGHGVELGLGQRVLRGDLLPPLEEPRSECPPVTPTRDDQDLDAWRFFPPAGGVPVVLGLGAFERLAEHSAPFCYGLLVAFG